MVLNRARRKKHLFLLCSIQGSQKKRLRQEKNNKTHVHKKHSRHISVAVPDHPHRCRHDTEYCPKNLPRSVYRSTDSLHRCSRKTPASYREKEFSSKLPTIPLHAVIKSVRKWHLQSRRRNQTCRLLRRAPPIKNVLIIF